MRPAFLILTPACCVLGYALAVLDGWQPDLLMTSLVLLGAVAAHISVNAFNEYEDFKSGLDFRTERTPFSGGSGALPAHPELSRYAVLLGIGSLAVTLLIGSYFVWLRGLLLIPFGALGILIILSYTRFLTKLPWLCLIAPGMAFGPLMVGGTYAALTGTITAQVILVSLVPFFLVNNLLLLNQYPDIAADRSVGRRNLPMLYGLHWANLVYLIFSLAALLLLFVISRSITFALLGYVSMALLLPLTIGLFRYETEPARLIPYLGLNVAVSIVSPVLMAVGILLEAR